MNATHPPRPLSALESLAFTARSLATYVPRPLLRRLAGRSYRRTPEAVIAEYEDVRRRYLRQFQATPPSLEEYLLFEADQRPSDVLVHCLDNRLVVGSFREASHRGLSRVLAAIAAYHPASVMEFGCGAGHNLLAIKHAMPEVRCIGLELTAPSVELGRAASSHYGLPVEFHQADVTKALPCPPCPESVDVCFSVHALEQIPDARGAFEQMRRFAGMAVVLFEPIPELWGPHRWRWPVASERVTWTASAIFICTCSRKGIRRALRWCFPKGTRSIARWSFT